jgi:6-pyruvoyltetrahydropterin/6-carboxytetrahydropterin synthase
MKVAREFTFDAAHFILDDKGSPCEEPHGHTYKLRVVVEGPVKKDGMVIDFRDIKRIVNELVMPRLDHKDLNKVLKNPTAENIAQWIFGTLKPAVKPAKLVSVRVSEGSGKWAEAP